MARDDKVCRQLVKSLGLKARGGYYTDANNNRYTIGRYNERQLMYAVNSNVNCKNCIDCIGCTDCDDCVHCGYGCVSCVKCENVYASKNCVSSKNLIHAENVWNTDGLAKGSVDIKSIYDAVDAVYCKAKEICERSYGRLEDYSQKVTAVKMYITFSKDFEERVSILFTILDGAKAHSFYMVHRGALRFRLFHEADLIQAGKDYRINLEEEEFTELKLKLKAISIELGDFNTLTYNRRKGKLQIICDSGKVFNFKSDPLEDNVPDLAEKEAENEEDYDAE